MNNDENEYENNNNNVRTNTIAKDNTNNSLNTINGNSITNNAAEVDGIKNNYDIINPPKDNSILVNTLSFVHFIASSLVISLRFILSKFISFLNSAKLGLYRVGN